MKNELNYEQLQSDKAEINRILARRKHARYMRYMWQKPQEPFLEGIHTTEICRLIDEAMENFRKGISSYYVIKVPFRHGKSDLLSRYLPSHFLGENPDCEVMLVTYASSLAETFSRFARNLIRTPEFASLYPDVEISRENGGVQQWGIGGHLGGCVASGLTSGLTGKGYHLGLLDDFNASRANAESEAMRNGQWENFTNDFLTRRAPTSITIVLATPWHTDDIIGRIEQKINPESDEYDPEFPPFKIISFPAMNGDVKIGVKNKKKYGDNEYHLERKKYKYLFPERFTSDWYKQQFASLGEYSASSLLQCNPIRRGGNLLKTQCIVFHNDEKEFPKTKYYRVWDLAHTEAQTQKDDPDYTSGTLLTFVKQWNQDGTWYWELWVKNVERFREDSPKRNSLIRAITEKDGAGVPIGIENSVESKDALKDMQFILQGRRIVYPIHCIGDKVSRMSFLEPIFEAGHVHVLNGAWVLDWLKELNEFPSGKHDDQVDNLSAGYEWICNTQRQSIVGGVSGI